MNSIGGQPAVYLLVGILGFVLLSPLYYGYFHPLRRYPGPFWAKFTDIWRFFCARRGRLHLEMIELHQRYGPVVRTGPTTISIGDPAYISTVYGIGRGFHKSKFYNPFQAKVLGRIGYNLFTTQDAGYYSAIKQPVANAYGQESVGEYEPFVDTCIVKFMDKLHAFADDHAPKACDLGSWFQYYAFDVIAEMTFGQDMGFIDQGADVNDMISRLDARLDHIAPNPVSSIFKEQSSKFFLFAASLVKQREKELASRRKSGGVRGPRLFIDRFLEAQAAHPNVIDDRLVGIYTTSNIVAGSDTVAIALRTIVYMLLRHPKPYRKLLDELDAAALSYPVSWDEAQKLPYLDAVIKEALRVHSPVGFGMERVVPEAGLHLHDGSRVPGGTNVSINPWVVHLDPVFGESPADFEPDRWLRADGESAPAFKSRIDAMKRSALWFGHGSRGCMGKYISYLEMYKLVPTMLAKLRFEFVAGDEQQWKTMNSWFVRQWDMDCHVKRR